MILISVKPPNLCILNFKVILPVTVPWMTSHCVEYWLDAFVCVKFDPRSYGDTLPWYSLEVCAIKKHVSTCDEETAVVVVVVVDGK